MHLLIVTAIVSCTLFSTLVSAQGYIDSPRSRAYRCAYEWIIDCGPVANQPQNVWAAKGFPESGPPDGHIAGGVDFPELDEERAIAVFGDNTGGTGRMWRGERMTTGMNTFTWKITTPQLTDKWEYFITKPGVDTTKRLKREDFEIMCIFHNDGKMSGNTVSHQCSIPGNGVSVILGVWTIADAPKAYYQVIDAYIF